MNVLESVGPTLASGVTPGVESSVESGSRSRASEARALRKLLEAGVRATLDSASIPEAEVSLTLVDDPRIQELNLQYLGRDRPTDVIAFPLYEAGEPVVGDIYVGADQARRQATDHGVPLEEELLRLAVHGTLHVLGHEHPEGEGEGEEGPAREESEMFRLQEELVEAVLGSVEGSDVGRRDPGSPGSRGDAR